MHVPYRYRTVRKNQKKSSCQYGTSTRVQVLLFINYFEYVFLSGWSFSDIPSAIEYVVGGLVLYVTEGFPLEWMPTALMFAFGKVRWYFWGIGEDREKRWTNDAHVSFKTWVIRRSSKNFQNLQKKFCGEVERNIISRDHSWIMTLQTLNVLLQWFVDVYHSKIVVTFLSQTLDHFY